MHNIETLGRTNMASHYYCATDCDPLGRNELRSKKLLLGSRLGFALVQADKLLKQSEGVSPTVSEEGGTPALGRLARLF